MNETQSSAYKHPKSVSIPKPPFRPKAKASSVEKGELDILVGTHRLLSDDVILKDLGLLIIDEEQRFGVTHKEKIKQYKSSEFLVTGYELGLRGSEDMTFICETEDCIVFKAIGF